MDGLLGSLLSEDATPDYRKAELLAKRTEIQEAQRTSPSLRISLKTPEPEARADEAIEVASEAPSEDVDAGLSFLRHEIIRFEARGSVPVAPRPSPPPAVVAAPIHRLARHELTMPPATPVPPPVALWASVEVLVALQSR
jgi:hypothetical protein